MKHLLLVLLLIPQIALADRSFYSAFSLVPGATAQGSLIAPNASSNILFGASTRDADITSSVGTGGLQISNNSSATANQLTLVQNGANGSGGNLWGFKTRSTTDDANTIIQAGDSLFTIAGLGADGVIYRRAAQISFESDATPGSGDMPGRIVLATTADGAASPTERLRISNNGSLGLERTNTAGGTTGAQTINKMAGSVNFAAAATALVVTNSLVSTSSNIFCSVQTNDATFTSIKSCVPGSGSFTINANAAATAETRVAFWVTN